MKEFCADVQKRGYKFQITLKAKSLEHAKNIFEELSFLYDDSDMKVISIVPVETIFVEPGSNEIDPP